MKRPSTPRTGPPIGLDKALRALLPCIGDLVLGRDRATRARTRAILLCAAMYAICCAAASISAELGVMRPFAPTLLVATCVPAYLLFYALVRTGRTRHLSDPALMVPQNVFALLAIAFAYTAVGPNDRGAVLVLIALVVVFGMYTHTPRQSAAIGVLATLLLGGSMVVLSHLDPVYYPPARELIRFELMAGTMPALILSGFQLASWKPGFLCSAVSSRRHSTRSTSSPPGTRSPACSTAAPCRTCSMSSCVALSATANGSRSH